MRVQKKKTNKKLIITIVALLLAISVGAIVYSLFIAPSKQTDDGATPKNSQVSDKASGDGEKAVDEDNSKPVTHESEKDIQQPYEGEDINNAPSLTGVVNYKTVVGETLVLRTTIHQLVPSGTCNLTMTNGQKTVTRSSQIMQNPSSSTCEGFDIPTAELSGGKWNIQITISSGDKTGTITDTVGL